MLLVEKIHIDFEVDEKASNLNSYNWNNCTLLANTSYEFTWGIKQSERGFVANQKLASYYKRKIKREKLEELIGEIR